MAEYRISGVWKDEDGVITHYAFHEIDPKSHYRAIKKSKSQAIALLESNGNYAVTIVWNYKKADWENGEEVTVVNGQNGKYLRSNPDDELTDNLAHLIDFDWIS
jgi:hypothetical protein